MNIVTGDLFNTAGVADYLLVTANSFVKTDGTLVMGRGAALQAKEKYPGIDRAFGTFLSTNGYAYPSRRAYRVVLTQSDQWDAVTTFGIFQVKYAWYEEADLELIEASAIRLAAFAKKEHPKVITMNYPGVGNGKRREDEVSPILHRHLWDCRNLFVYKYATRS